MKKKLLIISAFTLLFTACTEQDFEDSYADPSKVSVSSVEQQFAGVIVNYKDYVIPSYWNYFVVLRPTVNRWTQAVGWVNATAQYVPGAGLISDRWNSYYNLLAQYRELQKIYNALPAADQEDRRIYMIAAAIYVYDQTQKVVDLHGDIPFTEAGMLSTYSGDYPNALPKYDAAEDIYTLMLDDLEAFADELNTITVKSGIQTGFTKQDLINNGNLDLWKRYCNSLRVRMLMRVSDVTAFASRVTSEMDAILADPGSYPLVTDNSKNIQIEVYNLATNLPINLNAEGFRGGLEDWNGNIAGKAMIDNMNANNDPRLRVMFEPGVNAGGVYNGLDPLQEGATQQAQIDAGTRAIYNRSTFSRNQYFPGVLINAGEINFLLAEYYLQSGDDASAKTAYNEGIEQSILEYYLFRSVTNDNTTGGALTPLNLAEIPAYQTEPAVDWDLASTDDEKLALIATQKWLHFSILEPLEGWAEQRRLDLPAFTFLADESNAQELPPTRWLYAPSENTYNTANYNEVKSEDNLTTKIFWDVE